MDFDILDVTKPTQVVVLLINTKLNPAAVMICLNWPIEIHVPNCKLIYLKTTKKQIIIKNKYVLTFLQMEILRKQFTFTCTVQIKSTFIIPINVKKNNSHVDRSQVVIDAPKILLRAVRIFDQKFWCVFCLLPASSHTDTGWITATCRSVNLT